MKNLLMRRPSFSAGPWKAFSEFENEMEKWFGPSLLQSSKDFEAFDFNPATDFQETDKEYVLKLDVPGVKKEDVKIEVRENTISVRGERKQEREEKTSKRHISESFFGSFSRSFSLPQTIDENKVKAEYKDGVLKISIPKSAQASGKTIDIQ